MGEPRRGATAGYAPECSGRAAENAEDEMAKSSGICDMCGHQVMNRQRAHIVAEGKKSGPNLLMICPSCHVMFDTHIKPRLYTALRDWGVPELPPSWKQSLYEQNKVRLKKGVAAHKKRSAQK